MPKVRRCEGGRTGSPLPAVQAPRGQALTAELSACPNCVPSKRQLSTPGSYSVHEELKGGSVANCCWCLRCCAQCRRRTAGPCYPAGPSRVPTAEVQYLPLHPICFIMQMSSACEQAHAPWACFVGQDSCQLLRVQPTSAASCISESSNSTALCPLSSWLSASLSSSGDTMCPLGAPPDDRASVIPGGTLPEGTAGAASRAAKYTKAVLYEQRGTWQEQGLLHSMTWQSAKMSAGTVSARSTAKGSTLMSRRVLGPGGSCLQHCTATCWRAQQAHPWGDDQTQRYEKGTRPASRSARHSCLTDAVRASPGDAGDTRGL